MNEFALYHNLCNLCSQTEPYIGDQALFADLKMTADRYASKTYRVAVVGEFKRGKSSLVNALLGTEILPTDILPTTAVINRIRYSVDQKIIIYFKNGEIKESTIESLADYATKLDKEKEEFAETIRQIHVYYPFVLGQNRVELIDTPGLNDNESMTQTTLDILGEIDTAIVVISAMIPVSMTEQNLICDLIRQTDIYNLTFAVTFIDRVSDETEEQDRVVDMIKNRLAEDTLRHFCSTVDDPYLVQKAERILSQPNVYAVSSKQAIQGFIKSRNDLVECSRFKQFKYNLSALLTANQEKDHLLKIQRICRELEEQLPRMTEPYFRQAEEQLQSLQHQCQQLQSMLDSAQADLNGILLQMEQSAQREKAALVDAAANQMELQTYLRRFFVKRLSAIRKYDFCQEALVCALDEACEEANSFMKTVGDSLTAAVDALSREAFEQLRLHYAPALQQLGMESAAAYADPDRQLPGFDLSAEQIFEEMCDLEDQCILYVTAAVRDRLEAFDDGAERYLAACRLVLIKYHKRVKATLENGLSLLVSRVVQKSQQLQHDRIGAEKEQTQIADTIRNIQAITSEREGEMAQ